MTQAPAQPATARRPAHFAVAPPEQIGLAISPDLDELSPQRTLRSLGLMAGSGDALISQLADAAIESVLASGPPRQELPSPVTRPQEPTSRHAAQLPPARFGPPLERTAAPARDEFGAELSALEAAALREDAREHGPGLVLSGATEMEMPTDEELAMLLAGFEDDSPPPESGAFEGGDSFDGSDWTAAAVARELGGSRLSANEDDADAIQAEGAIEARGTVNVVEPRIEHEPLSITPVFESRSLVPTAPVLREGTPPLPPPVLPPVPLLSSAPEPDGPTPLDLPLRRPLEPPGTRLRHRPWWLAPLVWLNAPLAAAPQGTREAIAKAAVLALLNATAVLVYVLVIRR